MKMTSTGYNETMEKIPTLKDALHLMNENLMICSLDAHGTTIHLMRNNRVQVRAPGYSLHLSKEEWAELYGENEFFLYDDADEEELIDPEKDREYYSWRRK